jgi:LacI family transcriptional regulator
LLIFQTTYEESRQMLKGIAHFERTHEFWTAYHDDEARAQSEPTWLRNKPWSGIISRHTTPALAEECAALKIPLVDLNDSAPFPGVPKIRPDNVAIGHMGAEHLIDRGFFNLAFSGFANESWSIERREGFLEAARLAGRNVILHEVEYPGHLNPLWESEQVTELIPWLATLPKPIGIMTCLDMRARQVAAAAHAAGFVVPEDIAILGVNNDTIRCELSHPTISSVAPNAFESGFRAAEMLRDMIAGRDPKDLHQRVEPLGVITRRSTEVLAVDDLMVAKALAFIREHACLGIIVEAVAQEVHMCRSQLERKFRLHIGRSPQAEIRRVQMDRVRRLLAETDYPLKRIAEMAGFEHMEYMSVMFKRVTGETPGGYRLRVRGRFEATPAQVEATGT